MTASFATKITCQGPSANAVVCSDDEYDGALKVQKWLSWRSTVDELAEGSPLTCAWPSPWWEHEDQDFSA